MDSTLTTTFLTFNKSNFNPVFPSKTLPKLSSKTLICANFSSNSTINSSINENPFAKTLKIASKTAILTLTTTLLATQFGKTLVKAEPLTPIVEQESGNDQIVDEEKTPLSKLMESSVDFVDNLRELLHKKLENGEDEEGLNILNKLVQAQPNELEWKFLLARLLNELGKTQESREVFEDILAINPLSFEALFENALLMDRCGERKAVVSRLERALTMAIEQGKEKEARDIKLIIAQVLFLQKNVDDALNYYDELIKEDCNDFRPYFCKGMIFSLLDRNDEAKEMFAKSKKISPNKFEVEGYLRSPLSRMKLFDTGLDSRLKD